MGRDFKTHPTVNGTSVVIHTELTVVSVEHGNDPTVPRPDYPVVIWRGTVEPNNWTSDDIWMDETGQSSGSGTTSGNSISLAEESGQTGYPSRGDSTIVRYRGWNAPPINGEYLMDEWEQVGRVGDTSGTDFEEFAVSTVPDYWEVRDASGVWNITVEDGSPEFNGNVLQAATLESTGRLTVLAPESWVDSNDQEILYLANSYRQDDLLLNNAMRGMLRANPSSPNENAYFVEAAVDDNELRIRKYTNSGVADVAIVSHVFSEGTLYWVRFRVNGSSLMAKAWADGDAEPGWEVTGTDSDHTTGGVGVGVFSRGVTKFGRVVFAGGGATA